MSDTSSQQGLTTPQKRMAGRNFGKWFFVSVLASLGFWLYDLLIGQQGLLVALLEGELLIVAASLAVGALAEGIFSGGPIRGALVGVPFGLIRTVAGVVCLVIAVIAPGYYFAVADVAYQGAVEHSAVSAYQARNQAFDRAYKKNEEIRTNAQLGTMDPQDIVEKATKEKKITDMDSLEGYYEESITEVLFVVGGFLVTSIGASSIFASLSSP